MRKNIRNESNIFQFLILPIFAVNRVKIVKIKQKYCELSANFGLFSLIGPPPPIIAIVRVRTAPRELVGGGWGLELSRRFSYGP